MVRWEYSNKIYFLIFQPRGNATVSVRQRRFWTSTNDCTDPKDLSLLTHLSQADIHNLQAVGKEARTARQKFILKDDEEAVWAHIQTLKDSRVDIVLDNCTPMHFFPLLNLIFVHDSKSRIRGKSIQACLLLAVLTGRSSSLISSSRTSLLHTRHTSPKWYSSAFLSSTAAGS